MSVYSLPHAAKGSIPINDRTPFLAIGNLELMFSVAVVVFYVVKSHVGLSVAYITKGRAYLSTGYLKIFQIFSHPSLILCFDILHGKGGRQMITEMDRFTDAELTAIYNDPDAGGAFEQPPCFGLSAHGRLASTRGKT